MPMKNKNVPAGNSSQAMHEAMRKYALAANQTQKDEAYNQVSSLISKGISPYTKINDPGIDAFEYANNLSVPDWQEWRLYACILKKMDTKNSLTKLLKTELITYCENSAQEVNSSYWNFFHSASTKKLRMTQVASLTKDLYEAAQTSSDGRLLADMIILSQSFSYLDGSNLLKLLNKVIDSQNETITRNTSSFFHVPTNYSGSRYNSSMTAGRVEYMIWRFPI